jgi:hypothetical protein
LRPNDQDFPANVENWALAGKIAFLSRAIVTLPQKSRR